MNLDIVNSMCSLIRKIVPYVTDEIPLSRKNLLKDEHDVALYCATNCYFTVSKILPLLRSQRHTECRWIELENGTYRYIYDQLGKKGDYIVKSKQELDINESLLMVCGRGHVFLGMMFSPEECYILQSGHKVFTPRVESLTYSQYVEFIKLYCAGDEYSVDYYSLPDSCDIDHATWAYGEKKRVSTRNELTYSIIKKMQ
jgi:hypothetical protein